VVRIISDGSGGKAAGEFIMFLDEASDLTCRIVTLGLDMLKSKSVASEALQPA